MNAGINNYQIRNIILLIVVILSTSVSPIIQVMEGVPTLDLPSQARWVPGRKAGTQVLLDPFNVRLRLKHTDAKFKYFWCSRTQDLKCPVRVTYDRDTDSIIRFHGEHNHDSSLVKDAVMEKYQEIVQTP